LNQSPINTEIWNDTVRFAMDQSSFCASGMWQSLNRMVNSR